MDTGATLTDEQITQAAEQFGNATAVLTAMLDEKAALADTALIIAGSGRLPIDMFEMTTDQMATRVTTLLGSALLACAVLCTKENLHG